MKMLKNLQITVTLLVGLLLSDNIVAAGAGVPVNFDITKFGAVGDGKTLNTVSIQNAIDACSKSGGVVVVPKGKFITGAIFLKQGVNLKIEKDGVLKGSVNQADYLQINTRW
jgi:exo-poly-alpha-galacturonosidase